MEHEPREIWDRRREDGLMDELHLLRDVLEDVRTEVKLTNGRVARVESQVSNHHTMLYGSATDLNGDAGIVGMLRQLRKGQQVTIAILTSVAVPAALTVIATYLPRMFG
jgi:hypothetical protein